MVPLLPPPPSMPLQAGVAAWRELREPRGGADGGRGRDESSVAEGGVRGRLDTRCVQVFRNAAV